MDRKWKAGAVVGAPLAAENASDGYATGGDPLGGVPATKPGAYWYHMVTEELLALISNAGIALDKAVLTQVRDALRVLFIRRFADLAAEVSVAPLDEIPLNDVSAGTTDKATVQDVIAGVAASQAEMEAAAANNRVVTPLRQGNHPSALKAWAKLRFDGVSDAYYNVSSTGDTGPGVITPSVGTDFSTTAYSIVATCVLTPGGAQATCRVAQISASGYAVGSFDVYSLRVSDGGGIDSDFINFMAAGDQ